MVAEEERLTLKDILHDFRKGLVEQDYVEAHVMCMIEESTLRLSNEVEDLRGFIDGAREHVKAVAKMFGYSSGQEGRDAG